MDDSTIFFGHVGHQELIDSEIRVVEARKRIGYTLLLVGVELLEDYDSCLQRGAVGRIARLDRQIRGVVYIDEREGIWRRVRPGKIGDDDVKPVPGRILKTTLAVVPSLQQTDRYVDAAGYHCRRVRVYFYSSSSSSIWRSSAVMRHSVSGGLRFGAIDSRHFDLDAPDQSDDYGCWDSVEKYIFEW